MFEPYIDNRFLCGRVRIKGSKLTWWHVDMALAFRLSYHYRAAPANPVSNVSAMVLRGYIINRNLLKI
jgi:hypothetical protein